MGSEAAAIATLRHAPADERRRSANYKPNIWNHHFLKTIDNGYTAEVYIKRADDLKASVKHLLQNMPNENVSPLAILELIDDIQRLGLAYIFKDDIQRALKFLQQNNFDMDTSLHAISLKFRLFRQYNLDVSQDVFKVFMDTQGGFAQHVSQDIKGMLSLFDASYLGREGENICDEAKAFARKNLNENKGSMDQTLLELVNHALELPLHYNITRAEARWYINVYSRRKDANLTLLELAKLDYNMIQAIYQQDLINVSRWWENSGIAKKLPFVRNRLAEPFLWAVGMTDEPQYSYCREGITKLLILITVIDDIYDVHATFDEVKLFTDAIMRWDINTIEQLPYYMKLCFFVLYNTVNDFAHNVLKDHGLNILPYLKKKFMDYCKYLQIESMWFHTGYKPTLKEYLDIACYTIAGPLMYMYIYIFMTSKITKEALDYFDSYPNMVHWGSLVVRLSNDLGTSKDEFERGDTPKSVQCYMNDVGVTDESARDHIRLLVDETWKKMNAEMWIESPLPKAVVMTMVNGMRDGEIFYRRGDGYGIPDSGIEGLVLSLLVDPIPM